MNIRSLSLLLALTTACGAATSTSSSTAAPPPDDARAQRAVSAELDTLLAVPGVRSARAVVLDPRHGRIIAVDALDADGRRDPSVATTEVRAHGSTAKTITAAAALTHGAITLEDTVDGASFDIEGTTIADIEPHGPMTLGDAMAFSSNVGLARVYQRLGREALFATFSAMHLGHRIPEAARTSELVAARFAYGGEIEMTTLELATAYAAVANGGELHAPWRTGEPPTAAERVLTPEVAAAVMGLLEGTVTRDDGTATQARIDGVRVAGKTGTARVGDEATFGVFVGIVPADAPRLVIAVAVEVEGHGYSGGTIAAPAFARIGTAILRE